MSAQALLDRLEGVRRTGDGRWLARCPAHEDKRPSLSVRELDDGRVLVHCFALCGADAVLGAVGLDFDALFPPRDAREQARPLRQAVPVTDVLRALADELDVILIIAGDLEDGRPVKAEDFARLRLARERIRAAEAIALGR